MAKLGLTIRIGAAHDDVTDKHGNVIDRAALRKNKDYKSLRKLERVISGAYASEGK